MHLLHRQEKVMETNVFALIEPFGQRSLGSVGDNKRKLLEVLWAMHSFEYFTHCYYFNPTTLFSRVTGSYF